MGKKDRPQQAARKAVLRGITASLMITLAACGSAVAGSGSQSSPAAAGGTASQPIGGKASAGVALCANTGKLDRVVVQRIVGVPTRMRTAMPGGFTIRDAHAVRAMAATLCALPRMPRGVMSCPAILGGSYRLWFASGKRAFRPVTVETTGCRMVTGLGPVRRIPTMTAWQKFTSILSNASLIPGKHASVVSP